MFFQNRNVYPSNVWFITVIAFNSVGLLRNNYFKISSNAPSNLICHIWKFIFYSLRQFFDVYRMILHQKAFFFITVWPFSLFCVATVISEPFFARAYFRPDFAAIRRKKFAARYFWFKKQKETKEIHFWIVFGNLYLGDKNRRILFFSRKSSVVS